MITKVRIQGYRIYRDFTLKPNERLNLIVGANESGKSTLMEAVSLALTGRLNGRRAIEELNPYWFNKSMVQDFVGRRSNGESVALPEIRIELFLDNRAELQYLCGAINTQLPTMACPGVTLHVTPNTEYSAELDDWAKNPSDLLPVEYYTVDWRSFADSVLTNRPRHLATAAIDSRTVRSSSGVDHHMRQILGDHLAPAERAAIALAYRTSNSSVSKTALDQVNQRIQKEHSSLHDRPISLAVDQRSSWEGAVIPHVDNVPFSMSGQGQQASLKISLAMSRSTDSANFVMVEEPENHLSHTSLSRLLARMESLAGDRQQLFVTTHSSFVLNRLGLDSLLLMGGGSANKLTALSKDTVAYFQKLPGYDTLRLVLARKVVLVEGPSDEIIFEHVYKSIRGCRPIEEEVDVVSMRGLSLARCLELCAAIDKPVAALRDNDGIDPAELWKQLEAVLVTGRRELFVGDVASGTTLEPQLIHFNGETKLREMLEIQDRADLLIWMTREKTEAALRIATSSLPLTAPDYMRRAVEFLHA